jgi:hypothetical protein
VIDAKVKVSYDASDQVYGAPRILADLWEDGVTISRKTVAASTRRQQLAGISPRQFTPVTTVIDRRHHHPGAACLSLVDPVSGKRHRAERDGGKTAVSFRVVRDEVMSIDAKRNDGQSLDLGQPSREGVRDIDGQPRRGGYKAGVRRVISHRKIQTREADKFIGRRRGSVHVCGRL